MNKKKASPTSNAVIYSFAAWECVFPGIAVASPLKAYYIHSGCKFFKQDLLYYCCSCKVHYLKQVEVSAQIKRYL